MRIVGTKKWAKGGEKVEVEMAFLQCHNAKAYGDLNCKATNTVPYKQIHNDIDNELEILCIPPWIIEKVDVEIDHFHNAASFVEMPKTVINNYIKFIRKFKTKEISLISYEIFDPKTTFNPEELNTFFNNELNISWKKTLIKDYNKRLIYLTSP